MAILEELIHLSRRLGEPQRELVILAEGNTSAREDETTFWIKASGFSLEGIDQTGFVQVRFAPILQALENADLEDAQVRTLLKTARVDQQSDLLPSVETFMHAYLLTLPDVRFVAHTHPIPVLSLLCLEDSEYYAKVRMFPDEIVCCGPATCFVEYVDPGLPLACTLRQRVQEFLHEYEEVPKIIWLQNHGLIALGKTAKELESATLMAVKAARVLLGVLSACGEETPCFLEEEQIRRIHTRSDEHYRQRLLWEARE